MDFTSRKAPTNPKFENLVGRQFGRLTVVKFAGMNGPRAYWRCQCECGNRTVAASNHLKRGGVQSCGCLKKARKIDLAGKRFYRWVVIKSAKRRYWVCKCDCGSVEIVHGSSLVDGRSQSCGCWKKEVSRERLRNQSRGNTYRKTHGMSYTAEHRAWSHAKGRCRCETDAAWKNYGGRGIQMCERWFNSFEAFLEDVGPRPSPEHSLDRYPDNNGNYEPGNVRWATNLEQQANTRRKRLEQFSAEERVKSLSIEEIRAVLAKHGLRDPFADEDLK